RADGRFVVGDQDIDQAGGRFGGAHGVPATGRGPERRAQRGATKRGRSAAPLPAQPSAAAPAPSRGGQLILGRGGVRVKRTVATALTPRRISGSRARGGGSQDR